MTRQGQGGDLSEPRIDEDRELLERTVQGSQEALAVLVERHQDAIYRLARAMTHTEQEAEDVLQETFLAALRGAAGFRGASSVRTWLLTIARNVVLQLVRRRVGEPRAFEQLETLGELASWSAAGPEDPLVHSIGQREELTRALQLLSVEDREILVLRDLEGLSGEETAEVLGITPTAMKSRLHRARLRLAGVLRQGGVHGR